MYLLETIASAIPPSPPTMAVDVSHRPHKPGNSRLRTQVWVFIFYQHLGGYHMCYMGAVLISLNKGLPSDCSVLAPYSQQQLPAQDPAPSARISQCAYGAASHGLGGFSFTWSLSHQLCTLSYVFCVAAHRGSTFTAGYFSLLDRYYPYLCAWIWWSFKPGIGGLVKKTGQKVC